MFTFITIVSTPCPEAARGEKITNNNRLFPRQETVIAKIERRALTAQQAEKQALANADLTVRDGFGQIIESAEVTIQTIRKFSIEVG